MMAGFGKHWQRLKRSLGRRWREWRLPGGYLRLGTRYGGWWLDRNAIGPDPLVIDCGLGEDISFPAAFLARFGGRVIGIEPNPRSLAFSRKNCPAGMEIWPMAFWTVAGQTPTFHLPRPQEDLPKGADGVSGSLVGSHEYVGGGDQLTVETTNLEAVLAAAGREECDVLKLDIEGAEYDVLSSLVATNTLRQARQVLVEFHHGATHHTLAETQATAAAVVAAGFRLIHTEGRNYIFRRSDLG
jgi:FkbM family methyltransferase